MYCGTARGSPRLRCSRLRWALAANTAIFTLLKRNRGRELPVPKPAGLVTFGLGNLILSIQSG